jgi:recombination protein RecT
MSGNAVATRDDVADLLGGMLPELQKIAPKWFSAERVLALVLAARNTTPAIKECSKESIIGFMQKCATTGLEPVGAGGCWPVPFNNRKTGQKELTFIPDYRGLIYLGKKNDVITHAYADVVKDGDEFSIEKGDAPRCIHKPALRKRGNVIGAYAVLVLPDGTKHVEWMDVDELEKVRSSSKANQAGPWVDWLEEQYKKTVLKRAMKPFAGGNPHMQTAINLDNDALGLSVDKAPIAEPKAATDVEIGPPKAQTQEDSKPSEQTQQQEQQPAPSATPAGVLVLKNYSTKNGSGKKGPWTKHSCKGSDGKWYATFNNDIGKQMQELQGVPVCVTIKKEDQYGCDVAEIKAYVEQQRQEQEPHNQSGPSDADRRELEDLGLN